MTRILEYVEAVEVGGELTNRCRKCEHTLGPASADFKEQAGSYDEPISTGQPLSFGEDGDTEWVLRHFICPSCGVLYDVDMMPRGEPSSVSARLGKDVA